MKQKFKIIPEEIARTVTMSGYFKTFYEFNQTYPTNKAAYQVIEEKREAVGYGPGFPTYGSFRKAKCLFENGQFTGQVKYI